MANEGLYERNLSAFAARFPLIHSQIIAITEPVSEIVFDQGEAVDIDIRAGRLYGGDGCSSARAQAEDFIAHPVQTGYNIPTTCLSDSMLTRRLHQALVNSMADHRVDELSPRPVTRTGFAFVLGCGLGHHLPVLVEKLDAPHIVVCEAFVEFLRASLHAIDWAQLIERCDEKGKTLHIVCANSPARMLNGIGAVMTEVGPMFLDGSYFLQHYGFWLYDEVHRLLVNELPRQMVARGYYEDERKMLRNAATNLHRQTFHLQEGEYRLCHDAPAFLVGAGPSIDQDIETIRKWRDHAVLFSSGSALQVLLRNGIIPDYHTELENTYSVYEKLAHILEDNAHLFPDGVFRGIKLIASATLNPNSMPLFDDITLFFRDSSCSTLAFAGRHRILRGAAPTVANTSLTAAVHMGFREIYMFGFDCGWRDETAHHTKDSIYYTSDTFKTDKMINEYTLPGNFGGTMGSSMIFDWSRSMLEEALAAFCPTAFNCSDGALINGAVPKVGESIDLSARPIDRAAVLKRIHDDNRFFRAGEYLADIDMAPLRSEFDRFQERIFAVIDEAKAGGWEFAQFADGMWSALRAIELGKDFSVVGLIHYATLGFLKQACVFLNRIPDEAKRQAVTMDFYDAFRDLHAVMLDEGRQLIDEIAGMVAGTLDPEWTKGLPTVPGTTY
ncbi:MAG: 6-hydroxymethylpterin diphosphokinase MptE-like protein [Solirubrobacterales bacterium]